MIRAFVRRWVCEFKALPPPLPPPKIEKMTATLLFFFLRLWSRTQAARVPMLRWRNSGANLPLRSLPELRDPPRRLDLLRRFFFFLLKPEYFLSVGAAESKVQSG